MALRLLFDCQFCDARPDAETQRSLCRQLREPGFVAYIDARPGGWLIWRGGRALGPRRYACPLHRGELVGYVRLHYAAINSCVWEQAPYPKATPGPSPTVVARPAALSPPAGVAGTFLTLAAGACPGLDDLLLALAAEFRPVSEGAARERLDDFSRCLFGIDRLEPRAQAGCVSHALRHDLAFAPRGLEDPQNLMLDRVLERRCGHPLLLAVVAVELARRANVTASVCSSPGRWFACFGGEHLALVEFTTPGVPAPSPHELRRHCSHEVAYGSLDGLCHSHARTATATSHGPAQHAVTLRDLLHDEHSAAPPFPARRAAERSNG